MEHVSEEPIRTIEHLDSDTEYSYCDSYPDLEAALRYVQDRGYNKNIIAWGSSFSATLVIQLAVEHSKELSGVLSFSTAAGLPMEGCNPNKFVENLQIPALFLRPPREIHHLHIIEQIEALDRLGLKNYIAKNGVHGSSMLNSKRVKGNIEENWKAVLGFLKDATNSE